MLIGQLVHQVPPVTQTETLEQNENNEILQQHVQKETRVDHWTTRRTAAPWDLNI